MNATTFDLIAIGLAIAGILMRVGNRDWWATFLCTVSALCSTLGEIAARRGANDETPID